MKRICFWASVLIVLLSLGFFSATSSLATTAESPIASPSSQQEINYQLPYPGLLPDNPLYFLKAIRDKIVGFLISDPLKKTEFNLLQADKRLNAGIYLFDSAGQNDKKISLAQSTVSKAENYFEEALTEIDSAKMQGRDISEMQGKLKNALKKHRKELGNLIKKAGADFKGSFEREQERLAGFEQRLSR